MDRYRKSPLSLTARMFAACVLWSDPGWAGDISVGTPLSLTETVVVLGNEAANTPRSATEGAVLREQLENRPASRNAELLEFVPGLIATQHSGEGKANQYFLRGFNLDHGTDFAIRVDGMPVNMPSHAHGQGYADLNFIIPELLGSLTHRKGLLYVESGDFATAGSADFRYGDLMARPVARLTYGADGYHRLFAGGSTDLGGGHILVAADANRYDGPWSVPQDLQSQRGLVKYHQHRTREVWWTLTGMTYSSTWTATDQVPQRAVADGRIGRFGTVDPTTGGETERHSLSWEYQRDGWQFASYLIDYRLDLFSNFTYFLEDPVNGDQFEQNDRRKVYGFDTRHVRDLRTLGVDGHFAFGAQLRHDDIDTVGLYATRARERLATVREDRIGLSALGVYGEIGHRWSESVRTVAGARIDHQRANIGNGAFHDTLVSPKFSLVLGPWAETEYFAGVGRGFHSNDARGDPAALLAPGWGVDVGLRTNFISRTQVALAAFVLRLESELVYVGDAGNTEPNSESERYGLELSLVHTPTRWLILDADLAWTRARFVGSGVADAIPNAVPRVASFGATVSGAGRWNGGLRVRHLGSAPLVEDSSARSSATTLVNAQIRYGLSDSWSVTLAGFNLFDRRANDIAYFYSSRLPAEAAAVDDFHIHPVEPRHIRIGISLTF